MSNLRDKYLKSSLPMEAVECPEWGAVRVRALTGKERDHFEGMALAAKAKNDFTGLRSYVVCRTVIDDDGKRVFEDSDIESLNNASARPIDFLFDQVRRLSGMTDDAVEELEKNSTGGANA
jgi:hypothetical protein